jgi:ubiquinol-cytochrome c reductase iron-sulfur subunit
LRPSGFLGVVPILALSANRLAPFTPFGSHLTISLKHTPQPTMSLLASRINLLPVTRTLASGVPFGANINLHVPPSAHAHHGHGSGPRTDTPPKWVWQATGNVNASRINGEYTQTNGPEVLWEFQVSSCVLLSTSFLWVLIPAGSSKPLSFSRSLHSSPSVSDVTSRSSTGVPDYSHYAAKGDGSTNRALSYFMVGSLGVLAASGAKSTVTDLLSSMSASADVLALAKIEVEMSAIPEGELWLPP